MKIKLSPSSEWLLLHLNQRHPTGIASVTPVHQPAHIGKPGMGHIRGLIRRNWVAEVHRGIFIITENGRNAAWKIIESKVGL